jgi:hypothetical protein
VLRRVDRRKWLWLAAVGALSLLASASGAAPAGAGTLPSGRAYELVSPEHQGFPTGAGPVPNAINTTDWIDPAGGWVAYPSFDPFTGTSGQPGTFLGVRGSSAWTSTGLWPPFDQANTARPVVTAAISDDHSRMVVTSAARLLPEDTDNAKDVYLVGPDKSLTLVSAGATTAADYDGRSADAGHILFDTRANIGPLATGTQFKIYDWHDGTIDLVGVLPDGSVDALGSVLGSREGANSTLPINAISQDGSAVVFTSPVPSRSDPSDPSRVYVRLNGSSTIEASRSQCTRVDCNAPDTITYKSATPDGEHVLFTTTQQLTNDDTDSVLDLYEYDRASGELTRLSAGVGAADLPPKESNVLGVSDDGDRVYFLDATPSTQGIDLWDAGTLTRIGTTSLTMSGALTNCAEPGTGNGIPQVTPDGGVFVFTTVLNPADPSAPSGPGLYRYAADSGTVTKIADDGSLTENKLLTTDVECIKRRALSTDGSFVFFASPDPLVPEDVNGKTDVYEWRDGSIGLISSGVSEQAAQLLGTTSDARDVFFTAGDPLVPQDQDNVQDVYDARVGGGFPPPPPPPPDCRADACRPGLVSPPTLPNPGSSSFAGRGNVVENPPAARFALRSVKLLAKHGRVALRLTVSDTGTVRVQVTGRIGKRFRKVAKTSKVLDAGAAQLSLRLSRAALHQLDRTGRLRVRVAVRFSGVRGVKHLTSTLSK